MTSDYDYQSCYQLFEALHIFSTLFFSLLRNGFCHRKRPWGSVCCRSAGKTRNCSSDNRDGGFLKFIDSVLAGVYCGLHRWTVRIREATLFRWVPLVLPAAKRDHRHRAGEETPATCSFTIKFECAPCGRSPGLDSPASATIGHLAAIVHKRLQGSVLPHLRYLQKPKMSCAHRYPAAPILC